MASAKTFRHGQILRLVTAERIANQEELRRRLSIRKLRVTQATLSRDLHELKLVKTPEGYRPTTALSEEAAAMPPLTRALSEFLLDIRPAAERGAAFGGGRGRREVSGNRGNHRGRRHRADHHAQQETARGAAAKDRIVPEPPAAQPRLIA